ncbi:AGAP001581-PA [Anopheles gambiae str. PEST]|uniref:AGAP001581-PA n=1 Tax=Anopheles gambiae TaxID=7165 RepID=Q7PUV7_ANOGA|nr:AGAP001581-PA [Anopheles gambiae str. PEST]
MGKHDMKRGISQRSSDAGGEPSRRWTRSGATGRRQPHPYRAGRVGQTWQRLLSVTTCGLLLLLLGATVCRGANGATAASDACLECFLAVEEHEQPYELTVEASSDRGLSVHGPTELGVLVRPMHPPNVTCAWDHAGELASDLYALYDEQLDRRCMRTGTTHHEADAIEQTFYCFDPIVLLELCKLRKETELRRLERLSTQRTKRDFHPTGCSLNNLLSTNRKVYEFGLEHEGLKPPSQIILSTIFLVTDVLSEFYNRRIAANANGLFYDRAGSVPGGSDSAPPKSNPPLEVILLQTIKHQILHKLGLRERPRLTKHLNNEHVFEAFDRIYGNKINIGNTYAEEHYYRRYLTANLSSDLSGDFVDAFFRGPDSGTDRHSEKQQQQQSQHQQQHQHQPGGGPLPAQSAKQRTKSKPAEHAGGSTTGDKHNLFAGTKILSYAEKESPKHYASTNLVGKFTQSVRRIVQDVKDEGSPSGMSREELLETNERLRAVRLRLEESYDTAKKALVNLMNKYGDSKSQRNIFNRYPMLKLMIKDVIRLETQYWTLVEIPKQEKLETVPAFVLRACSIMEKSQKSGEGVKTSAKLAEEAAERRERMERLETMTTAQIEQENTQMINDLYRLLKKYTGLRNLIRELKSEYGNSKIYPIFPRYTMLKDMIKDIMHDPDYMEVCHEVDN